MTERLKVNLVLIGFRCSGKTSVGEKIAQMTGRAFCDMDKSLEAFVGSTIPEIVSEKGWPYFRKIEKTLTKKLSEGDAMVIASGGGVVLDEENTCNLKRNGRVVWLKADAERLRERMKRDRAAGFERPALSGVGPVDEVERLMEAREPFYEKAADLTIDTTALSVEEVAALVVSLLPLQPGRKAMNHVG